MMNDWNEAKEIVERMKADGWVFRLVYFSQTCIASFEKRKAIQDPSDEVGDLVYSAEREHMPEAVKKAANTAIEGRII